MSENKLGSEVLVGTTTRPDGSIDDSQAMSWNQPGLADKFRAADEKKRLQAEERAQEVRIIPPEVKPGTGLMVWYRLRKALGVAEANLELKEENRDLISRLKAQKEFLEKIMLQHGVRNKVQEPTASSEVSSQWQKDASANEYIDLLMQDIDKDRAELDRLRQSQDPMESTYVADRLGERVKSQEDLLRLLTDELSNSQ